MGKAEPIEAYFKVLRPHSREARERRPAEWAVENQEVIKARLRQAGPVTWYSKVEIVKDSGVFTDPNAVDTTAEPFFRSFGYEPKDLAGKRLLDIGAFSGGMSFFAEDWGAEVVAIDIQSPETNGFALIHDIRQSCVTHVVASIYDIHPDLFGIFDVVVFSGVHYHLKHPLLALERLSAVTKTGGDLLALGTAADYWIHKPGTETMGVDLSKIGQDMLPGHVALETLNEIPLLAFYRDKYMLDDSNWFIPNTLALADMVAASGYDVLSTGTFSVHRPLINAPIACALVKARKAREPKAEYLPDVYADLRRFSAGSPPSSTFSIPTWYELERQRRENMHLRGDS